MKKNIIIFYFALAISGFQSIAYAQDTIVNKEFHQKLSKKFYENIHQLWDELLQKHVSDNGHVNYNSIKKDHKELLNYIRVLTMIASHQKFETLSNNQKIAYWINAYNALTIDLIIRNYPVKSIKDIKDPWDQKFYTFNGEMLSLNQIEHDILRKMDEPRIHFAIVCASESCPKLQNKAFVAKGLY